MCGCDTRCNIPLKPVGPQQDTVVALQALARYGAATYSREGASVVELSSLGGASWRFTVDQSTRLLYQEQKLDQLPGDYRITAQGQGCVQAQVGHPRDRAVSRHRAVSRDRAVSRHRARCARCVKSRCVQA